MCETFTPYPQGKQATLYRQVIATMKMLSAGLQKQGMCTQQQ